MPQFKNWKTLALGLLTGLPIIFAQAAKALDDDPKTEPNYRLILEGFGVIGLGAVAKDYNVTGASVSKS